MPQEKFEQNKEKNPYEVLGFSPPPTKEEITQAFRKLISQYHPDKNPGREKEVEEKAKEIIKAYEAITNSKYKPEYSQQTADFSNNRYGGTGGNEHFNGSDEERLKEYLREKENASKRRREAGSKNEDVAIDENVGNRFGEEKSAGTITINGNAGNYLGCRMRGGSIYVHGKAGENLGEEMNGGTIVVDQGVGGNACEGMKGGEVIINGSVRNGACKKMTGGTVTLNGNVGPSACEDMRNGTVIINGFIEEFNSNALDGHNHGTIIYRGVTLMENGKKPKGLKKSAKETIKEINAEIRLKNKERKKNIKKQIEDGITTSTEDGMAESESNEFVETEDTVKVQSILEKIKNAFSGK